MIEKGDRAVFNGYKERFVGVITSYHFCDMGTKLGYPEGDHWRATMRCDPGQYGANGKEVIEVEGNVSFFEPTKERSFKQFMAENPEVAKAFKVGI